MSSPYIFACGNSRAMSVTLVKQSSDSRTNIRAGNPGQEMATVSWWYHSTEWMCSPSSSARPEVDDLPLSGSPKGRQDLMHRPHVDIPLWENRSREVMQRILPLLIKNASSQLKISIFHTSATSCATSRWPAQGRRQRWHFGEEGARAGRQYIR